MDFSFEKVWGQIWGNRVKLGKVTFYFPLISPSKRAEKTAPALERRSGTEKEAIMEIPIPNPTDIVTRWGEKVNLDIAARLRSDCGRLRPNCDQIAAKLRLDKLTTN